MRYESTEIARMMREREGIDPVEAAFRAVACLSDDQKDRFAKRFNEVFGDCVPPLSVAFSRGGGSA